MTVPLTVIVLTKNEEENIKKCLRHLMWAAEVVVLDSYSTDRTVEIVRGMKARIVQREFDDFSSQRNWALDGVELRHEWVMFLDADEIVSDPLVQEIARVFDDAPKFDGYYIRNQLIGRWVKYPSVIPNWKIRLFRRDRGRYENRLVHEHLLLNGKAGYLQQALLNDDHKGFERYFERHNEYSTLEAVEVYRELARGVKATTLKGSLFGSRPERRRLFKNLAYRYMPARPLFKFIWMYVIQLCFLNGRIGLRYCLLHAFYEYQISLKLEELKDKSSPLYVKYRTYLDDDR